MEISHDVAIVSVPILSVNVVVGDKVPDEATELDEVIEASTELDETILEVPIELEAVIDGPTELNDTLEVSKEVELLELELNVVLDTILVIIELFEVDATCRILELRVGVDVIKALDVKLLVVPVLGRSMTTSTQLQKRSDLVSRDHWIKQSPSLQRSTSAGI